MSRTWVLLPTGLDAASLVIVATCFSAVAYVIAASTLGVATFVFTDTFFVLPGMAIAMILFVAASLSVFTTCSEASMLSWM